MPTPAEWTDEELAPALGRRPPRALSPAQPYDASCCTFEPHSLPAFQCGLTSWEVLGCLRHGMVAIHSPSGALFTSLNRH